MNFCRSRLLLGCVLRNSSCALGNGRPVLAARTAAGAPVIMVRREKQSQAQGSPDDDEAAGERETYGKFLRRNLRLLSQEVYEKLSCSNLDTMVTTERTLWRFAGPESFGEFRVQTDGDIGGQSWARLEPSRNNKLLFHGHVCTSVPRDGETARSGYCALRSRQKFASFNRKKHMDLTPFNSLNMRLRGDGRAYMVNILTEGYFTDHHDDIWSYFLFTRGGPYWQDVSIPFSKFFLSSRGRIQDKQAAVDLQLVNAVGLTLADAIDGEFALEMDSISVSYDATHTEEFAYEMYK